MPLNELAIGNSWPALSHQQSTGSGSTRNSSASLPGAMDIDCLMAMFNQMMAGQAEAKAGQAELVRKVDAVHGELKAELVVVRKEQKQMAGDMTCVWDME